MTPLELVIIIIVSMCCMQLMLKNFSSQVPFLICIVIMVLCTNASYSTPPSSVRSAKKTRVTDTNDIKQCKNPRFESKEETQKDVVSDDVQETISTINHSDYSIKNHQSRRDEFIFRNTVNNYQSGSSRESMLNAMYKELVDTSLKSDPGLKAQDASESCAPVRGVKKNSLI